MPLAPVLVEARMGFDFGYWRGNSGDVTSHPDRVRGLKTYVFPQVALWNPYSVPIRSSKPYTIIFHSPSQLRLRILKGTLETWPRGAGRSSRDFRQKIPLDAATWADALDEFSNKGFQGGNYGDFFHFALDGSYTIPPGEVLVYRSANTGSQDWRKYPADESLNSDNALRPTSNLRNNIGSFRFNPPYTPPNNDQNYGHLYFQEVGVDATTKPGVPLSYLQNATYSIRRTGWSAAHQIRGGDLDDGSATTLTYPHVTLKLKKIPNPANNSRENYMEFPSLQRLTLSPGGERPIVWPDQLAPTDHTAYDTSFWLPATDDTDSGFFREHTALETARRGGEPPPVGFQIGYRLLRFDEEDESSIIINGKPRFDNAVSVSPFTFNVRSPSLMRIPNAYWDSNDGSTEGTGSTYRKAGWLNNLVTGLYLIEWFPRPVWGDAKYDPVVGSDGLMHGAPFSVFSKANTEGKVIAFDFPDRNYALTSLADFRHAMLSPFNWHPSYVVGNSQMDPFSDPHRTLNRTLYRSGPALWRNLESSTNRGRGGFGHLLGGKGINDTGRLDATDILLYNVAFEVNHSLFDNYFLSTLLKKRETRSTWDGEEPLPNARLKLHKSVSSSSVEFTQAMNTTDKMFHTASSLLVNEGAFNVNSTSVEAWVAFLSSTLNVNRPLSSRGDGGEGSGAVQFSKLLRPFTAGNPDKDLSKEMGSGYRALSEDEVRRLAEKIVEEVKFRGPFLSLSDFVNRRLVGQDVSRASQVQFPETEDISMALKGALDAAIEKAEINAEDASTQSVGDENDFALATIREGVPNGTMNNAYVQSFPQRKSQDMAGWLTQMDILSTLAPAMTARSDTFKIRVYGDCKSPNNIQPDATAYLEITVQRQPYFYDTTDAANTPVTILYDNAGKPKPIPEENTQLKSANRQFGRKFEIVSLRWISPNEI